MKAHHSFTQRSWVWAWGIGKQGEKGAVALGQLRQSWEPGPACSPRPACSGGCAARGSRWAAALAAYSIEGARDCPVLYSKVGPMPGLLAVPRTPGSATRGVPASAVQGGGSNRDRLWSSNEPWHYKLAASTATILAGCPGSSPSGFGGHLGTLAMTEETPSLKPCIQGDSSGPKDQE